MQAAVMLFGSFERMVAFRYLRARRREGFISVIAGFSLLGIALGVATLIIVMAVMNGFRDELIGRILGLNGHLNVYAHTGPMEDYDRLAERVRGIDMVVRVTPTIEGQALVTQGGSASGAVVRGVPPEDWLSRPSIVESLRILAPEDFSGTDVVAIGARMAQRLGVGLGDSITMIAPQGSPTAFGTVPRMRAYEVAAIFNVGMFEYDNNFVYMPLEAAQIFYRMPGQVSTLEVFIRDPNAIGLARATLNAVLQGQARLWDWQQANSSFFNALQVERNVMFLILTLIILVAAFNIISGMVMLVKDKGRDIAILRTMGASIRIDNEREFGGEMIGDLRVRAAPLHGVSVSGSVIPNIIDEIPILAVAAAVAEGRTEIRDAAELRVKETDRIAAMAENLRSFGVQVEEFEDGIAVEGPATLEGTTVDSFDDHRIAMASAIAGLVAEGETRVKQADCAAVSFPAFWEALRSIRTP